MDELSTWINKWIECSSAARARLEQIHHCEIDGLDFQEAYRETLGLEKGTDLLYQELPSIEEFVEMFKTYDFASQHPEILQEIYMDKPILPADLPRLLTEQTIKSGGEIWRIHKNDADPLPSSPHAHNMETGLKLHLGSGELFNKSRLVRRISCKDLLELRSHVKKEIKLPDYTCN